MKRVEAIIQPRKLSAVSLSLHHSDGATGVTVTDVRGWGHHHLNVKEMRTVQQVVDFEPHVRVEVVCADVHAHSIADAIRNAAHTGLSGDGIVMISKVEEVIRISTGAHG